MTACTSTTGRRGRTVHSLVHWWTTVRPMVLWSSPGRGHLYLVWTPPCLACVWGSGGWWWCHQGWAGGRVTMTPSGWSSCWSGSTRRSGGGSMRSYSFSLYSIVPFHLWIKYIYLNIPISVISFDNEKNKMYSYWSLSTWSCSSGSWPWLYLELQKLIGRLPDEHNQVDRLEFCLLQVQFNFFCYKLISVNPNCQARLLLISVQISEFHTESLSSETKGAELMLKSQCTHHITACANHQQL